MAGPGERYTVRMSRGRTVTIAAGLLAMLALWAACSSSSSKSPAERDREAQAKIHATVVQRNRVAAVQRRKAAARRRAVAVRRATMRANLYRNGFATKRGVSTRASVSPVTDPQTVQSLVDALNSAFSAGVAVGIRNSETANFWVGAGVYTAGQCGAFEAARGQGVVSEALIVHTDTFRRSPGWVDPVIGRAPTGRVYRVVIDEIQTLVPTGQHRARTFPVHVTIRPDGRARLFLRCA